MWVRVPPILQHSGITQLVECDTVNIEVIGSSPIAGAKPTLRGGFFYTSTTMCDTIGKTAKTDYLWRRVCFMKITKEQLRKIILEEVEAEQSEAGQEPAASGDKEKADVTRMLKLLPNIDNPVEYGQILTAVLKHAEKQPQLQKVRADLTKLYRQLPKFIKGLK